MLRSANGIDYVQATFVGKQPSFVGTRITGIVAAYNATANTFTLGTAPNVVTINASGASVMPSGSSIANGEVVSVWSNGTITANMLTANVVNVRSGLGIAGETLAVSGPISAYVSQASFVVNGVTVDASAITLPMGVSALANGMTVAVSGTVNSNGTLAATQLRVFSDQDDTTPPVVLQGDIGDFVSAANFTVRGVVVDASHNPTFNSGFSAANLQDGAFVKITGTLTNNVVVATSVTFTSMHGTPVLDLKATVQSYTASSGALTVTLELPGSGQSTTVTITLGSSVTYDNGSAAMLTAGQKIKIHAIYDAASNTFTVTAISFMPPGNDDDQGSSNRGNGGNGGAGNPVLLQGIVTAVNPGSGTVSSFTVHGLTINVGTASVSSAPGLTGGIAVGDLVAIYGTNASTDDTVNASAILVAPAPAAKGDD
ncbi:MAG: hypothetical protein JO269_05295 [Burkholderiaceae bacterium]|nr:hypothetical protein [Burkholderiaceae bacterium]